MHVADIARVVDAWVAETITLGARPDVAAVQIFENRGEMMGAPTRIRTGRSGRRAICRTRWSRRRARRRISDRARAAAARRLPRAGIAPRRTDRSENDHFVTLTPFWAIWPFETMILPRRRIGGFDELQGDERMALAGALSDLTRRYDRLFDVSFPYSMGFHQKPTDGAVARRMADARAFLSAAPALGDGEEIHGRLRDARLAAARPDPRGGGGAAAGSLGRAAELSASCRCSLPRVAQTRAGRERQFA